MLEVRNLGVSYRENWAVQNVSFSLESGQMTGLLGPNGSGKSSVVKAMLGLVPKVSGKVQLDYRPLQKQLRRVAYVPQRSQIDWDYPVTVWNVVMMGRTCHTGWFKKPSSTSLAIAREALERVGMAKFTSRQIGELSGGQQQRVFLARAIAQQADVLFLDEPFAGVDAYTEEIMFEVFQELKADNKTLLIISHDLGESLNYYDQLILLNQRLIAMGEKAEVLTTENLRRAYGNTSQSIAA